MNARFYLKNLLIQNFATFKNQTINFRPGFNAIVGETGSGKSLVLDALELILGGRADKRIVRRDTAYSLVEAHFTCDDQRVIHYLEQEGYPLDENELIVKRLIYKNGTTKNYINHLSCTVHFLNQFAKRYVDLVGQFENQKLLSETYQLQLLDHYSKIDTEIMEYQKGLLDYKKNKKQFEDLEKSKTTRDQRIDYLSYQLQEIEKVNPSSQDEQDLLKKKDLMMNMERTQKLSFQIGGIVDGQEGQAGLISQLKFLSSLLIKHPHIFKDQADALIEIEDKFHHLHQDIQKKLQFEVDANELEVVLDRLDSYQKLKKKFGGTVENILHSQVEFLKEKNQLEELDLNFGDLESKIQSIFRNLNSLADKLHDKRVVNAKKLSQELTFKIRNLKMDGATVSMALERITEFTESGLTRAFFKAETNPGEGFFKIKEIASGGELSRILLSVRQILSCSDSISIFLFDEIATGIGGETANCIGKALCDVAKDGQVIAITHLPQIAQFADALIVVQKEIQEADKRTESYVREVIGNKILKEVKAMSGLH